MTLLNTAANLGGTYPASLVMWLLGAMSTDSACNDGTSTPCPKGGRDPYVALQLAFMVLGCVWILVFRRRVQRLEHLPEEAWRTHLNDNDEPGTVLSNGYLNAVDVELGGTLPRGGGSGNHTATSRTFVTRRKDR